MTIWIAHCYVGMWIFEHVARKKKLHFARKCGYGTEQAFRYTEHRTPESPNRVQHPPCLQVKVAIHRVHKNDVFVIKCVDQNDKKCSEMCCYKHDRLLIVNTACHKTNIISFCNNTRY